MNTEAFSSERIGPSEIPEWVMTQVNRLHVFFSESLVSFPQLSLGLSRFQDHLADRVGQQVYETLKNPHLDTERKVEEASELRDQVSNRIEEKKEGRERRAKLEEQAREFLDLLKSLREGDFALPEGESWMNFVSHLELQVNAWAYTCDQHFSSPQL